MKNILTYISHYYIPSTTMYRSAMHSGTIKAVEMVDAHIRKVYVPMTETAFYILLCLRKPNHGYGVVQSVERMTDGEIKLAPGTMYGSLSKMEKDHVIEFVKEEDKRKKIPDYRIREASVGIGTKEN